MGGRDGGSAGERGAVGYDAFIEGVAQPLFAAESPSVCSRLFSNAPDGDSPVASDTASPFSTSTSRFLYAPVAHRMAMERPASLVSTSPVHISPYSAASASFSRVISNRDIITLIRPARSSAGSFASQITACSLEIFGSRSVTTLCTKHEPRSASCIILLASLQIEFFA